MQNLKKILLIAITVIFIVGQFLWTAMFYLTGVFILVLILIALKEYSFKKVALILSTLSGYPLAWLVTSNWYGGWNILIWGSVIVIVFIGFYVYLLRRLWVWIDSRLLGAMVVALLFLSGFAIFMSFQVNSCFYVSAAEKGVSVSAVQWCKLIGMYSENAVVNSKTGLLKGFLFMGHSIVVYLPVLSSAIVLFSSLLMNRVAGAHRE